MNEEIENVVLERILRRQEKANEEILKTIGEILGEIGQLTPSDAYTIGQQLKYGESLQKIIKIISETSNISEVEIYKMLEAEARKNLELKRVYFEAKKVDFIPYEKNIALQNKVREIAIATVGTYRNISKTTGLTFLDKKGNRVTHKIKEAYNQIVDDAIMNVSTGKETFYESLKNQLHTIGQSGVQSIEYESGYHRRLDSALRMNLSDGLNELAIAQQEIVGEQFGFDAYEVTVHAFPAPDHAPIQGHIFDIDEYEKLQDYNYYGDIKDITGRTYTRSSDEHIRPIGQLNCYHNAFSIIKGVDRPRYSQEQLDKINEENKKGFQYEGKHYTLYDGTQLQRRLETQIRKNREEQIITKASYEVATGEEKNKLKIELDKIKSNTNALLNKYHEVSKISGLPTKLERTRVLTK